MAKVLIIIGEFYPLQNATANCVMNICSKIREIDSSIQFDVLCFKTGADDSLESHFDFYHIYRIDKDGLMDKNSFFLFASKKRFPWLKKSMFLIKKIIFRLREKASLRPWRFVYKDLYHCLNKLDEKNHYDYLMCVSGNYSTAFCGALFKEKRNFKLITYLTDPLLENPIYSGKKEKYKKDDFNYIYSKSDCFVVTPIIYDNMKQKEKALPLEFPSFFEKEIYTKDENNIVFDNAKKNLLYTGLFYQSIRSPDYLMRLISEMPDSFVLHVCGKIQQNYISKYKELAEAKKVLFHGNLSHQLLFNAIHDCDFLVNIGNSVSTMLPSKLISYISTGKPIINLVKKNDCPTLSYLSNYPDYLNIFESDDFEKNKRLLMSFVSKKHLLIPKDLVFNIYNHCTIDYIAQKFYESAFRNNN